MGSTSGHRTTTVAVRRLRRARSASAAATVGTHARGWLHVAAAVGLGDSVHLDAH
jgi:pyrroloquinoline quinone (PQQ) biosynthesis protein C